MAAGAVVAAIATGARPAHAKPEFVTVFQGAYAPKTGTPLAEASCSLCHVAAGPPKRNPYGDAVKTALEAAGTKTLSAAVLAQAEAADSDGDRATNRDEIASGTLPGDPASHPEAKPSGNAPPTTPASPTPAAPPSAKPPSVRPTPPTPRPPTTTRPAPRKPPPQAARPAASSGAGAQPAAAPPAAKPASPPNAAKAPAPRAKPPAPQPAPETPTASASPGSENPAKPPAAASPETSVVTASALPVPHAKVTVPPPDESPTAPLAKPAPPPAAEPLFDRLVPRHSFHPILVHFPIALFLFGGLCEVAGARRRNPILRTAAALNMSAASAASLAAVATGFLVMWRSGFPLAGTVLVHMLLAIGATALMAATAMVGWRFTQLGRERTHWVYWTLLLLSLALVGIAGHFGGELVYGS